MKINVAQVKEAIGSRSSFKFITSAKKLDIGDENQWADNAITVEGEIVNTGRLLEVKGQIKTFANYRCDRCLDEFQGDLDIAFFEQFKDGGTAESNEAAEETVCLTGDEIDLAPLVRESILLAQPISTVCSEDCRGLCSKCGHNLNLSDCACDRYIPDPRLAELQRFFDKK